MDKMISDDTKSIDICSLEIQKREVIKGEKERGI